jgi:hypothetical protein
MIEPDLPVVYTWLIVLLIFFCVVSIFYTIAHLIRKRIFVNLDAAHNEYAQLVPGVIPFTISVPFDNNNLV